MPVIVSVQRVESSGGGSAQARGGERGPASVAGERATWRPAWARAEAGRAA